MMPFIDLRGQTANLGHSWGPFGGLVTLWGGHTDRLVSEPQRGPLGGAKGGPGQAAREKTGEVAPVQSPTMDGRTGNVWEVSTYAATKLN